MINEIFKDYEKQQKKYLGSLIKVLDLDIPPIVSVIPKSNHDIEEILKITGLVSEDDDISDKLEEFYIHTMKRAILSGIPVGKTFMVKLHRDDEEYFNKITSMDSLLFLKYVNDIGTLKDITDNIPNEKFDKDFEELSESKQIELIVESVLYSFFEFTDENKMMIDYHFEEMFNILDIDLKLAKKKTNKRILLGEKSKLQLISAIFKEKEGKFRVSDLVREHCFAIFQEGMRIGIRNGIKIVIDDITSGRVNHNEFNEMNLDQLSDYFYKELNQEFDEMTS